MKKIILLLVLATSARENGFAQPLTANEFLKTPPDKIFDLQPDRFKRKYMVALGKGNTMQVELGEVEDLEKIKNADSLLAIFLQDMKAFRDSLSDELKSKRIDYITDAAGKKKIRIQVFSPAGNNFLLQEGSVAALKLAQDTVYIVGEIKYRVTTGKNKDAYLTRYYRIGFFINNLEELAGYTDGRLANKIAAIQKSKYERWKAEEGGHLYTAMSDNSISAIAPNGFNAVPGDYVRLNAGVSFQNYKNYFVPAFYVNASLFINSRRYKYEVGLAWEPHYIFSKNTAGNLQAYRNDFLTLNLGFEPRQPGPPVNHNEPHIDFLQHFSVGYLVSRKGDFYDAHTFSFGTGGIEWFGGKIKLEPLIYTNFTKHNASPGVRLIVNF